MNLINLQKLSLNANSSSPVKSKITSNTFSKINNSTAKSLNF